VEFEGEPGLDQGGLRREWFEVLCKKVMAINSLITMSMTVAIVIPLCQCGLIWLKKNHYAFFPQLFHPKEGLFVSVEDNGEAVYPNPNLGSVRTKESPSNVF